MPDQSSNPPSEGKKQESLDVALLEQLLAAANVTATQVTKLIQLTKPEFRYEEEPTTAECNQSIELVLGLTGTQFATAMTLFAELVFIQRQRAMAVTLLAQKSSSAAHTQLTKLQEQFAIAGNKVKSFDKRLGRTLYWIGINLA